jgi:hypothetical protein
MKLGTKLVAVADDLRWMGADGTALVRRTNRRKGKASARFGAAVMLALLATSCKDAPGADGRYAHGYGYLYRAGDGPWAP